MLNRTRLATFSGVRKGASSCAVKFIAHALYDADVLKEAAAGPDLLESTIADEPADISPLFRSYKYIAL